MLGPPEMPNGKLKSIWTTFDYEPRLGYQNSACAYSMYNYVVLPWPHAKPKLAVDALHLFANVLDSLQHKTKAPVVVDYETIEVVVKALKLYSALVEQNK